MKNARNQLKPPAWHRRRAYKLSAAVARQPSKIGGFAHNLSAAPARPVQGSNFIKIPTQ